LTAAISDAGLGLHPEKEKTESMIAKRNIRLYFISALVSFQTPADHAVLELFPADNYDEIVHWICLS
jgi:hypothetical protein